MGFCALIGYQDCKAYPSLHVIAFNKCCLNDGINSFFPFLSPFPHIPVKCRLFKNFDHRSTSSTRGRRQKGEIGTSLAGPGQEGKNTEKGKISKFLALCVL